MVERALAVTIPTLLALAGVAWFAPHIRHYLPF